MSDEYPGVIPIITYQDGVVTLSSPTSGYQGPRKHRESCAEARIWSEVPWVIDGVLVYVPNVDEHYATAREAGALILSEPTDEGHGRGYRAEDLEGHRWMFVQRELEDAHESFQSRVRSPAENAADMLAECLRRAGGL